MTNSRHVLEGFDAMLMTDAELARQLLNRFKSGDYQPPKLPSVAMKLMEVSRNPNATVQELVKLLEQDQLMAGKILKLSNSAAYRGSAEVASLRDAVVRLGMSTLRDVVMHAAMDMRVFRANGYSDTMDALRRHSLATAHVARILARGHELAFLAGLMHDVGIAGALLAIGDVPRGTELPGIDLVWPAVESIHERAGVQMCRLWQLPAGVIDAVANHHVRKGKLGRLAAIVTMADNIASQCGYRICPDDPNHLLQSQNVDYTVASGIATARKELHMDDDMFKLVLQRSAQELMEKIGPAAEPEFETEAEPEPTLSPMARITGAFKTTPSPSPPLTGRHRAIEAAKKPTREKRGFFGFGRR